MFSREDYAFAARMLGLPTPITPDEQAAAAPVVAEVQACLLNAKEEISFCASKSLRLLIK